MTFCYLYIKILSKYPKAFLIYSVLITRGRKFKWSMHVRKKLFCTKVTNVERLIVIFLDSCYISTYCDVISDLNNPENKIKLNQCTMDHVVVLYLQ